MTNLSINLTNHIKEKLKKYPSYRDNYLLLLAALWKDEAKKINPNMSITMLLNRISSNRLTSPETVRRTWQKVLQHNPQLRGPGYKKRHTISQTIFRKALNEVG
jgi:hypothetical protein